MGFVNHVVSRSAVLPKAEELAFKIAENGPLAVRKIKEAVQRSSGLPLDRALAIEDEVSAVVLASRDAREGPRAFREKRKPRFTGE
jgi:enoyl-CoA hydratase/carnithine racemase